MSPEEREASFWIPRDLQHEEYEQCVENRHAGAVLAVDAHNRAVARLSETPR